MHSVLTKPGATRRPDGRSLGIPLAGLMHGAASGVLLVAFAGLWACGSPQLPTAELAKQGRDWSNFKITDVLPEGEGRELVLENCQSCHVLVPILVLPMDESAWSRNGLEHRERVEGLSDEEFTTLYDYLSSTFTPERPKPELPPALLDTWTTY